MPQLNCSPGSRVLPRLVRRAMKRSHEISGFCFCFVIIISQRKFLKPSLGEKNEAMGTDESVFKSKNSPLSDNSKGNLSGMRAKKIKKKVIQFFHKQGNF